MAYRKFMMITLTALSALVLAGFVSASLTTSDAVSHHPNDRANHHPLHANG